MPVRQEGADRRGEEEVGHAAVERWMVGRAERMPEFRQWRNDDLLHLIHATNDGDCAKSSLDNLRARRK